VVEVLFLSKLLSPAKGRSFIRSSFQELASGLDDSFLFLKGGTFVGENL